MASSTSRLREGTPRATNSGRKVRWGRPRAPVGSHEDDKVGPALTPAARQAGRLLPARQRRRPART